MIKTLKRLLRLPQQSDKIFVPEPSSKIGGPSTFSNNFVQSARALGVMITHDADEPGVSSALIPISHSEETLWQLKARGVKIYQRLDGIYYPSKHGQSYIDLNREINMVYRQFADHIIFQSLYSRDQVSKVLGPWKGPASIIHNGCDTSLFNPSKRTDQHDTFRFVSTGNFRNSDMLVPVIEALNLLCNEYEFVLTLVGPVKADLMPYLEQPYIKHFPSMDRIRLAGELQSSDAFVYSHLNPPCPNSVIEAIGCGLPVIGFDSGAMSELCHFNTELLAPVSAEVLQVEEDLHPSRLSERLKKVMDSYSEYRTQSLSKASIYSLSEMTKKYLDVLIAGSDHTKFEVQT